ncbi:MAG: alkaline phosphatase D family protein [Pseudomonadota bacterium]
MIDPPRFDRRRFLLSGAAVLLLPACASGVATPAWRDYPFSLGVASGSPLPDGVVLWTRLLPAPPGAVAVRWELARDEHFRDIVQSGAAHADPHWGHSVHVEVSGLQPARWYWYRFMAGDAVSPVGRTRTAPAAGAQAARLRLAFASCQHYEQGYYAAHRHMAREDLDLVVFLGDYIYESSRTRATVRRHDAPEPYTLEQYRSRYALYKSDPDLQRCHARFPWIVTWDDHEVDNDYANDRSQDLDENFLERRAAAYQAYYEHMPLRAAARPRGPHMRLYERYDFGALARFHVLDGRQYRTPQACPRPGRGGSNFVSACAGRLDPARTLLGAEQEAWLARGLDGSPARWNIIAQQTLMARINRASGDAPLYWTDGWDGYPAARRRLLDRLAQGRAANPVVIGGDVHSFWVCDLKPDFDDAAGRPVATEFVTTSISSQGPSQRHLEELRHNNPHVRLCDGRRRGYTVLELTPGRCTATLRTVENAQQAHSAVGTRAVFVVEDGQPGALPA